MNSSCCSIPYTATPRICATSFILAFVCASLLACGPRTPETDGDSGILRVDTGGNDSDVGDGGSEPVCGNGAIENGESCDDGNEVGGDGCSSGCAIEDGGSPTSDVGVDGWCGNGAIDVTDGEACDDGDQRGGDGCSADCSTVESGWSCPFPGNACVELCDGCNIYYVAVAASSSNDGVSEENPWTLTHAFDQAQPGDLVYVKAGDYGDLNLESQRDGTAERPIRFIGYTSAPGDLSVVDAYSSYTYADFDANGAVLPSDIMPLIETDRGGDNDPDPSDRAMLISHDWIHIENFMAQFQNVSFQISGANVTMVNCYSNETGNWDPSNAGWNEPFSGAEPGGNLSGYGFYARSGGRNFTLRSSTVFNAGADGLFLVGADFHVGEYNQIYADKSGNSTDYHYVLYETENAMLNHNKAFRYLDRDSGEALPHRSRGLAVKHGTSGATINDFYVYNTRLVVYQEANDNMFTNVVIDSTNEAFTGQLIIAGNSNRNVFVNTRIINGSIGFNDYNAEGYPFNGSGSDNYFINTIIEGVNINAVDNAFINVGNSVWSRENSPMVDAGTNYFLGGTFYNADYVMVQDRPLVEFVFRNILFGNVIDGFRDENIAGSSKAGTLTFENCNFSNTNFATPVGTNLSTSDPSFVDELGLNFRLSSSSPVIDQGVDTSGMHALSGADFLGVPRPQGMGYDVGAYEYE